MHGPGVLLFSVVPHACEIYFLSHKVIEFLNIGSIGLCSLPHQVKYTKNALPCINIKIVVQNTLNNILQDTYMAFLKTQMTSTTLTNQYLI